MVDINLICCLCYVNLMVLLFFTRDRNLRLTYYQMARLSGEKLGVCSAHRVPGLFTVRRLLTQWRNLDVDGLR